MSSAQAPALSPLAGLDPSQRARVILAQARSQLDRQLWQAALGRSEDEGEGGSPTPCACQGGKSDDWSSLLAQLQTDQPAPSAAALPAAEVPVAKPVAETPPPRGLGRNAGLAPVLETAAARTGIPAAALAAIVDAEAGKRADGSWNPNSRNPRSSAAGLGQFLNATWIGMAETKGSHLNALAARQGWLDQRGKVRSEAKGTVLAARYDAATSIQAIADYSAQNLRRLRAAGISGDGSVESISRLAYSAHYLGPADAAKFLTGKLGEERSRTLLTAQIGAGAVARRIAESGSAEGAHRNWLQQHLARNVRPQRYG